MRPISLGSGPCHLNSCNLWNKWPDLSSKSKITFLDWNRNAIIISRVIYSCSNHYYFLKLSFELSKCGSQVWCEETPSTITGWTNTWNSFHILNLYSNRRVVTFPLGKNTHHSSACGMNIVGPHTIRRSTLLSLSFLYTTKTWFASVTSAGNTWILLCSSGLWNISQGLIKKEKQSFNTWQKKSQFPKILCNQNKFRPTTPRKSSDKKPFLELLSRAVVLWYRENKK